MKNVFLFLSFLLCNAALSAQQLVVVNGGMFGGANNTNLGLYNAANQQYTPLDTLGTSSAQDAYIEANRYLYVAAGDSIFKYDLSTQQQLAAAAFGGVSGIKMEVYQNYLLVGNWYGLSSGNLRIFDKNTLSFVNDIPEIVRGATDFVVIGDEAYIAQNLNDFSTNYMDSLGYLSVVDLQTMAWLRNDTLAAQGEDLGRLWYDGDSILYSFNSVSNSISSYNIYNQNKSTDLANSDLQLNYYGNTIFPYAGTLYIPQMGGFAGYNLATLTADAFPVVNWSNAEGFGWAMDTLNGYIYVSGVFYSNQAGNFGKIYNISGDSIGVFPVGASPEILTIWYDNLLSSAENIGVSVAPLAHVFPNPTADKVFIESLSFDVVDICITDLSGKLVYQQNNFPVNQYLYVNTLSSGIYNLSISDKYQKTTIQLVIEH